MASDKEFETATLAYAAYLGVDLDNEPELIQIAREALEDLPNGWEVCISDEGDSANIPFFHNSYTEESVWHHPHEDVYLRKVKEERRYLKGKNEKETPRYGHDKTRDKDKDRNKGAERERNDRDNKENEIIEVEDFDADFGDHGGGNQHDQSAARKSRGADESKNKSAMSGRGASRDRDSERRRSASPIFGDNWLPDSTGGGAGAEGARRRDSEDRGGSRDRGGGYRRNDPHSGPRWDSSDREHHDLDRGPATDRAYVGDHVPRDVRKHDSNGIARGGLGDRERLGGGEARNGAAGTARGEDRTSTWDSSPPRDHRHGSSGRPLTGATSTEPYQASSSAAYVASSTQPNSLWLNTAEDPAEGHRDGSGGRPLTSGHMGSNTPSESTGRLQGEVRRLQEELSSVRLKHQMEVQELELVIESLRSSLQVEVDSSLSSMKHSHLLVIFRQARVHFIWNAP